VNESVRPSTADARQVKPLPPEIQRITVPESFSPSQWARLEACPLSVWAEKAGELPESIEMVVGRILHDVRARYRLVSREAPTALDELLVDVVEEYETRLRGNPDTAGLIPVPQVFGQRKWVDVKLRLRAWAEGQLPTRARRSREAVTGQDGITPSSELRLGDERPWNVPRRRLRGRPDHASLTSDGALEIVDYKSGNVLDREGVLPSVVDQLHLYALMSESLTDRPVRLSVQGRQRIPIEWGEAERAAIVSRLSSLSDDYPAGALLDASTVARPGSNCVGCRVRPQCQSYLHDVPCWWPNTGEHPRPLPLDSWGTLRRRSSDFSGSTLHIEDAAGRAVLISGIHPRHGVDTVDVGDEVYGFTLAAGEDQFMHGRWLHPRAFHERSPSARWRSAASPIFYARHRHA
jgi:PD-(D/E)XK nuclease superfamily